MENWENIWKPSYIKRKQEVDIRSSTSVELVKTQELREKGLVLLITEQLDRKIGRVCQGLSQIVPYGLFVLQKSQN